MKRKKNKGKNKNSISPFPTYADWLKDYCKDHKDVFVKDSSKMIEYCFELDKKLPEKYGWRYSSEESLSKQIEGITDPKTINQIYWTDIARNVEAYSTTTFWRGVELLKPAIRSLNVNEVITPAVLARSLLELACSFIINANILEKNFTTVDFKPKSVVVCKEIEEMVVKMIWGTRYGNPEKHLTQKNILGFIQKASKHPNAKEVQDKYDFLCDLAHPSFIGNTRFWSHIRHINPDGSESRVIEKYSKGAPVNDILDNVLWTLGWSAAVIRNSFHITTHGLKELLNNIK